MIGMEVFKENLHTYINKNGIIVIEPFTSCPLKDTCPFAGLKTPLPCKGADKNRVNEFHCNIYNLIEYWVHYA